MIKLADIKYVRHIILSICLILLSLQYGYSFEKGNKRLTVLFTNDIHSNANPRTLPYETRIIKDGDTLSIVGGYARLATLIDRERVKGEKEGAVILVDAGDMAMGTIFHSVYQDEAFELRTMSRMGYDAYTFGNHDFDYGVDGLAKMIGNAHKKDIFTPFKLPYILAANVKPHNSVLLDSAFNAVGVRNSVIIENNGVRIGIIGLLGEHAYSVTTAKDNIEFISPIEAAKREVAELKKKNVDFIVAISHGGTLYGDGKILDNNYIKGQRNKKYPAKTGHGKIAMNLQDKELIYANSKLRQKSQDGTLAMEVPEIDVIISGHDHEYLYAPFIINRSIIGSSGGYNCMLGKMVLEKDSLISYELLPITRDISPNETIQSWIDTVARKIDSNFYVELGIFPFDTIGKILREYNTHIDNDGNMDLGHLIAKSYKYAALKYSKGLNAKDLVALTPAGVIRNNLAKGDITYNDVFNVLSLGKSANGEVGYPLVLAWLHGKELIDVCEMVATVSPKMGDTRLFFDGLTFTYNKYKLPFTKVTGVKVNGTPVEKNKLYPVVTGMYTAMLISLLKGESYGILRAQPKDSNGVSVGDLQKHVIKKTDSTVELSEWLAFAEFLSKDGVGKEDFPLCKSAVNESDAKVYLLYIMYLALIVLIIYILYLNYIKV